MREWEILYTLDPWGSLRSDMASGVQCSLIDACNRTKGKPEPPISYMPYVKALVPKDEPKQTDADMKAQWELFLAMNKQ